MMPASFKQIDGGESLMVIHDSVFIADGARLVGDDITIGGQSSVWYNAVIRCTGDKSVVIGERTNIQDLCMLHTATHYPVKIGDNVTIGHQCIIHGCTIGDNTLIGMGTIIMDGAEIGDNCIIGAGSLVTAGVRIPDGQMAFGRPAKVIRPVTDEQKDGNMHSAEIYVKEAEKLMKPELL